MPELDDQQLLAKFAGENSEAAFATLVSRYVNLVYSAALRFTGNPDTAEEITQVVFIILARKAGSLRRGTVLSGWLYQTARLTAANAVKREIRRRRREKEAFMQSTTTNEPESAWEQMAPLLEEAMGGLGETDRNAVVLRFFENKTAREVAMALEMKEEAAHKRVNRALEKLRKIFARRGIASTTTIIAGALSANSVQAAPVALAKSVTAIAFAKGATASVSTLTLIKGALKIMAWTKTTTAVGALVIAGAITAFLWHHHEVRFSGKLRQIQHHDEAYPPPLHLIRAEVAISQAMKRYETEHGGIFPTNLNQLNGYFSTDVDLGAFELINIGMATNWDQPPGLLVLTERKPRLRPDGKWDRLYLGDDGSVQEETSDDGNFSTWEQQQLELSLQSPSKPGR